MAGAATKLKHARRPAKKKVSRPVDYRLNDFDLDVPGSLRFDADISESILSATLELTIEGASTLTLTIDDADGNFLQSDTLTTWVWGQADNIGQEKKWLRVGRAVDAKLDDIDFRLVKVSKAQTTLTLTFEERIVSLLRRKKGARKTSRAKLTRAQFVGNLVKEVKAYGGIKAFIPEAGKKQAIARAKPEKVTDSERSDEGKSGIAKGTKLTVADAAASPEQTANMQRVLDVAGAANAPEKATLALVMACIVESGFKNLSGGDADSVGILQVRVGIHDAATARSVEKSARAFLTAGFASAEGAIELARNNPNMSAGELAQAVQGSAFPGRYDDVRGEATKIVAAYGGGGGIGGGSDASTKSYQFARGKEENSWDALGRLAEEVRWKRFVRRGKLWFVSEDYLFRQRPELRISESVDGVDYIDFDVDMFARPTKQGTNPVAEVKVQARADRWTALPGMIVEIETMGLIDGRWIVSTVSRSIVDDGLACEITLRKPVPQGAEPAAETGSRTTGGAGGDASSEPGNVGGQTSGLDSDMTEFLGVIAGKTTETISVSSGVRPGDGDSNHQNGRAADIDVGGDARSSQTAGSKGDNIATAVLVACGEGQHNARNLAKSGALNFSRNFKWKTHSVEIGWRTMEGGNHFNHVHVGFDS